MQTPRIFIAGLVFSLVFLPPAPCSLVPELLADETQTQKIGVVRMGTLFRRFDQTQRSEEEIEKLTVEKQKERERIVSEIRSLRDDLALMTDEARAARRQEMEGKLRGLAEFDQEFKEKLRGEREEAVQGIVGRIEAAVAEAGRSGGFDLILSDQAAPYAAEGLDVTEEVLKILNSGSGSKRSP